MNHERISPEQSSVTANRREFARLHRSFQVRYGVCGAHGPQVPGFTRDMGIGGICFSVPSTDAVVGDHLAVEIAVPGHDDPLYFLGQVKRVTDAGDGVEIALRFDYLGKSENYKELLSTLVDQHGGE